VIVVDTGVLLAAVSSTDRHHRESAELLAANAGQLVTPALVIVETAWMIESALGPVAEAAFVRSVANGELGVQDLGTDDYNRCADLIERYADLGLGLVDDVRGGDRRANDAADYCHARPRQPPRRAPGQAPRLRPHRRHVDGHGAVSDNQVSGSADATLRQIRSSVGSMTGFEAPRSLLRSSLRFVGAKEPEAGEPSP